MGGGIPIKDGQQLIGGIGVSGGTTEQDIAIVEAALSQARAGFEKQKP
ncbi:heme-binding protein [Frateuria edaphi]|nr:heme-binding protein [Frateuria edaphi]UGB45460.1 heme-binding protein [Frateuria edaphi]